MADPTDVLQRLRQGNGRFVAGLRSLEGMGSQTRRQELVDGQSPVAVILGCSDSRVPVEMVFDQGLGDLFVIRVAGNIVAPSQIGSIEFAAEYFGTRLVVVMGHSQCGAVKATLDSFQPSDVPVSPNLQSIVDRIRPAIADVPGIRTSEGDERARVLEKAVRANVESSVSGLRHGSDILENLVTCGELMIVGAHYSLETGKVDFFPADAGGES